MKFNLTAHREMWLWLAENPDKNKWNWPGWKKNGGTYEISDGNYHCFACDYAGNITHYKKDCESCPLIWVRPDGSPMEQIQYVCEHGSCYDSYKLAYWYVGYKKDRCAYATMIANLQVKEGVETE